MHKKPTVLMTERDLKILKFIWRWKLATTRAIWKRYFPTNSPDTTYNRLNALERGGLIEARVFDSRGTSSVWTLAERGFRSLQNELPQLREEGFRSENLEHDYLTAAIQLGEWLQGPPDGAKFFTEQELRRYYLEHFPSWVPRSSAHRPDGYWLIPQEVGRTATFALEVELSQQKGSKYDLLGQIYREWKSVSRVVWAVRTHAVAASIRANMQHWDHAPIDKHLFIVLGDFLKRGWQATIVHGAEAGRSLASVLGARPLQSPGESTVPALLDARRRAKIWEGSSASFPAQSPVCMAIQPSNISSQNQPTLTGGANEIH